MAGRRANNEGTIYKEQSTDLWVAEITLPGGKRKRKRNKRQAIVKDWLQREREAVRTGLVVLDEKVTLGEFLDRYLADVVQPTLKPKTVDSYTYIIQNHLKPEIGQIRLSQLRPDTIASLYAKKLGTLSKRTVQYIHAVLRKSLNEAVKWGLIYRNPTDAVTAPTPAKKPPETLTVEQITKFLESVKDHRWYPIYLIAIGCGLREGEILGLRKRDVNLVDEVLQVTQTVVSIRGKLYINEPKSEASRRPVAMPSFVVAGLREPWEKAGDLLFTTSSGKPISPRNLLRHFHGALEKAGIPRVKFHSLRHTFVSLLISQNVPIKDVQEIVGHSSPNVTLSIYAHMLPGGRRDAANKIEKIFAG